MVLCNSWTSTFLAFGISVQTVTLSYNFNTSQLHSTHIHLYEDGDKYAGQWDGWKGIGEVNYKDGRKYTGEWGNG